MTAASHPPSRNPPIVGGCYAGTRILPGRSVLLVAGVLAIVLTAAALFAWHRLRPAVVADPQYRLEPEQIQITPPPEWIHADVRAEALRNASLDQPVSILDPTLTARIAAALAFHPWVAKVRRVTKQPGPIVRVELVYRRPILMVQVAADGRDVQLNPADIAGVRLPDADFTDQAKLRYPRLVGVVDVPLVGSPWHDPRVAQAAHLVTRLGGLWGALRLEKIRGVRAVTQADPGPETRYVYTLTGRNGLTIYWGHALGQRQPGEASDREKRLQIQRFAAAVGGLAPGTAPRTLDLRQERPVPAEPSPGTATSRPGVR